MYQQPTCLKYHTMYMCIEQTTGSSVCYIKLTSAFTVLRFLLCYKETKTW